MSDVERLLVPGCTELPPCRCGEVMHLDHTLPLPERTDTHIRVYRCRTCGCEMRLTVWGTDPVDLEPRQAGPRGPNNIANSFPAD
jgi:hypothetical protein